MRGVNFNGKPVISNDELIRRSYRENSGM